jgi:hypothetical protein
VIDLCDGCHYPLFDCACDEREAQRAEQYGPICRACNGAADNGYENCEFAWSGVYEPGPGSDEAHGCPRLTGTF